MAFGFSPKYCQDYPVNGMDKEHFLTVAIETALKLDWNVSFISETGFIAYTKFSWSSWSEEITVKIDNEAVILKSECTGNQIMDWGKNKKNVETFISTFETMKISLGKEEIESKLQEYRQSYVSKENDILIMPPATAKEKITGIFSLFIPTEGYFVTPILIDINILIFIAMMISGVHILLPENQDLLQWGANFRLMTLNGESWRLFTACFLHIGILHLLLNMYALMYIGVLLEPYLGKTRFLSAYLISGIAASVASLWWNDLIVSAGASGAIFGMYGVFLALLTTNLLDKSVKKSLMTSIAVFVGYNILYGLKPDSGIDNAAHIGGLFSGFLIGYAFIPSLKNYDNKLIKYITISVLSLLLIICSNSIYKSLPNDFPEYEKAMEEFSAMESMALEVFNLPEETSPEKMLSELKDRGIYYWNKNIILLDNLYYLDLPAPIIERIDRMKIYCQLRIQFYELLYRSIEEDTDKYTDEIHACDQKIAAMLDEFSK